MQTDTPWAPTVPRCRCRALRGGGCGDGLSLRRVRHRRTVGPVDGLAPPPPPGGSLCYCTCAQEAISTKSAGRKWLVGGLKDHRYLSVTKSATPPPPRIAHPCPRAKCHGFALPTGRCVWNRVPAAPNGAGPTSVIHKRGVPWRQAPLPDGSTGPLRNGGSGLPAPVGSGTSGVQDGARGGAWDGGTTADVPTP